MSGVETSRSKMSGGGAKRPGQKSQGRNILVQNVRGRNVLVRNVQGRNVRVQNVLGRNVKFQNVRGQNVLVKNVRGRNVLDQNVRGRCVLVQKDRSKTSRTKMSGRNVLVQNLREWNAQDQKVHRRDTQDQTVHRQNTLGANCPGAKRPCPKCQGVKGPERKCQGANHAGPKIVLWNFLCPLMIVILHAPLYDCNTSWALWLWHTSWLWNFPLSTLWLCDSLRPLYDYGVPFILSIKFLARNQKRQFLLTDLLYTIDINLIFSWKEGINRRHDDALPHHIVGNIWARTLHSRVI